VKESKRREEWHPCDMPMMVALSGITETPGKVTPIPIGSLNPSLQRMEGLTQVYASGYVIPQADVPSPLISHGEFVMIRQEGYTEKGYCYGFARCGEKRFFNGPYKYFEGHHSQPSGAVDIYTLFGNIPPAGTK